MKKEDKAIVEKIQNSLNNPSAIVRALELLFENQTFDEQDAGETRHKNNAGFSCCDARTGTWLVSTVIAEGREKGYSEQNLLRGRALEMGRKIVKRYTNTQLLQAAKAKLEEQAKKERNAYTPPTPAEMDLIVTYNNL